MDITESEIITRQMPGGEGYQALLERNPGHWEHGENRAEAFGKLAIRMFKEFPGMRISGHIEEQEPYRR